MSKYITMVVGMMLVFFAMWMSMTSNPFFHSIAMRLDNISYDFQLRLRLTLHPKSPKTPIAILAIDDKSIKTEGSWPWPRSKLANLVDKLGENEVSVMIFDMFFAAKSPNITQQLLEKFNNTKTFDSSCQASIQSVGTLTDQDLPLEKSLSRNNAILGFVFLPNSLTQNKLPEPLLKLTQEELTDLDLYNAQGYISNISNLQKAAKGLGFINIQPDKLDGIIRRAYLIMEHDGGIYPNIALASVLNLSKEKLTLDTHQYGTEKS